jgi:hypothetical protein
MGTMGNRSLDDYSGFTVCSLHLSVRCRGQALQLDAVLRDCPDPVGSFLEERKLVREFGDKYQEYQQAVSMLFPWRWLKAKI